MTKGKPRTKLNRYERAEYDRQTKARRNEFVFSEMLRDPDSRFHGMSYAQRPGCPCRCERCEAERSRAARRRSELARQRREARR